MEAKKIKAMKGGGVKLFSKMTWDIAHPETQGWTKIGEVDGLAAIDAEEISTTIEKKDIEVVEIQPEEISTTIEKKEIEVVEIPPEEEIVMEEVKELPPEAQTDASLYPSDDEIKEFIKEKTGKAPHHMAKTKRLRELYDENK